MLFRSPDRTIERLTLVTFESGDLKVPALTFKVRAADGAESELRSPELPVAVRSLLADGFDPARIRDVKGAVEMPLEPADPNYHGEVAERWRYKDGSGEIGVISSVTQAFCRDCNRARLSAEGKLYTCLFAIQGHDFKSMLRNGATDDEISQRIARTWSKRADRYSEIRSENTIALPKVEMSHIGG